MNWLVCNAYREPHHCSPSRTKHRSSQVVHHTERYISIALSKQMLDNFWARHTTFTENLVHWSSFHEKHGLLLIKLWV